MKLNMPDERLFDSKRFKRRESITQSIGSSPSTILMNIIIEGIAALILVFGVVYLTRFLFAFRSQIEELHFTIFIAALVFFSIGWGTHIILKLRSYYLKYRAAISRKHDQSS